MNNSTGVTSLGAILGKMYGDPGVPSHQNPSLSLTNVVQRRAKQYIWHKLGCRGCQKEVEVDNPTALGAPLLVFPQGLLLKPFPRLDVAARQQRFEIRVFLLLDELPSQANKLHLPKATGFEAPGPCLCSFSCQ